MGRIGCTGPRRGSGWTLLVPLAQTTFPDLHTAEAYIWVREQLFLNPEESFATAFQHRMQQLVHFGVDESEGRDHSFGPPIISLVLPSTTAGNYGSRFQTLPQPYVEMPGIETPTFCMQSKSSVLKDKMKDTDGSLLFSAMRMKEPCSYSNGSTAGRMCIRSWMNRCLAFDGLLS